MLKCEKGHLELESIDKTIRYIFSNTIGSQMNLELKSVRLHISGPLLKVFRVFQQKFQLQTATNSSCLAQNLSKIFVQKN